MNDEIVGLTMNNESKEAVADAPRSVAAVYEDEKIAASYLQNRMRHSWQRLLHKKQLRAINAAIRAHQPNSVLELAPGPARLSAEVVGVRHGVMVENSAEMISIARARLAQAGTSSAWTVIGGDAFDLGTSIGTDSFEFAYSFRFIRHFREAERNRLYEQLRQHLAPAGLLMFDVVNESIRKRLDARQKARPAGEIAIYDACYNPESFKSEMHANGFDVVSLVPVLRRFGMQSFLSGKLDDVTPALVRLIIAGLENVPSSAPLEWVALCRKR